MSGNSEAFVTWEYLTDKIRQDTTKIMEEGEPSRHRLRTARTELHMLALPIVVTINSLLQLSEFKKRLANGFTPVFKHGKGSQRKIKNGVDNYPWIISCKSVLSLAKQSLPSCDHGQMTFKKMAVAFIQTIQARESTNPTRTLKTLARNCRRSINRPYSLSPLWLTVGSQPTCRVQRAIGFLSQVTSTLLPWILEAKRYRRPIHLCV